MRRLFVSVAAIGLVFGAAGIAGAQVNDDTSADGTTGLFMVPRAGTLEEGTWALGGYGFEESREEGDSRIRSFGITATYGLSYRMEIFVGFRPYVEIDRRFTAERVLLFMDPRLTGLGINEHPFAFVTLDAVLNGGTHDGAGALTAGFKYKFIGDPYEYDGLALQAWAGFPTSAAREGIGCGCFQLGGQLIGSLEAWDLIGYNIYGGYRWWDSPSFSDKFDARADPGIAKFFISPEFLYGVGFHLPTRASLQLVGEWMGTVTTRNMNQAYTGGDDVSLLQGGLRLSTESGLVVNAGANYNTTINLRDAPWQLDSEALDDSLRRWGWFAGLSYSTSRRQPLRFMGTRLADVGVLNNAPTLSCEAEHTTIREGESVRIFATTSDMDGDAVEVSWKVVVGSLSASTGDEVTWSSRGVAPGSGEVVARADDSYGGTADCTVRLTVEAKPPPPKPTVLEFTIGEFPSGNARIDNRMKAVLDDIALQLRQNSGAVAVITGYSDSRGSVEANDKYALERADNAKAYLVDTHGIDPSRISAESGGSTNPVGDNDTRAGRSQNRRIEIVVTIPPR